MSPAPRPWRERARARAKAAPSLRRSRYDGVMRLTLALIPLACALGCALDNPAFLTATVTDTLGTSDAATSAATSGAAGSTVDPTQPATTAEPTTGVSTTGVATSNVTTDGNTTPPDQTTGNVSSGTSTSDPGSSSEPVGSSGGVLDMGGPMMCSIEEAGHAPAPFMRPVDALNPMVAISGATCSQYAGMELKGKLYIYPDGFSVKADPNCASLMGQPSVKFPMPWMLDNVVVGGNGSCVVYKFEAHPQYVDHCAIASVVVFKGPTPILAGRFGTAELSAPIPNFVVGATPKGLCTCPGCCPDAPDPDTYMLKVGANDVPQGAQPLEVFPGNIKHYVVNFRSDVHPECTQDPDTPNWLHFDWIVARAAG